MLPHLVTDFWKLVHSEVGSLFAKQSWNEKLSNRGKFQGREASEWWGQICWIIDKICSVQLMSQLFTTSNKYSFWLILSTLRFNHQCCLWSKLASTLLVLFMIVIDSEFVTLSELVLFSAALTRIIFKQIQIVKINLIFVTY